MTTILAEEVHNATLNYRIIRHHVDYVSYQSEYVSMHEVYYENGRLTGYTEAVTLDGFSDVDELIGALEMMLQDAENAPVIDEDDLPGDVDDEDN